MIRYTESTWYCWRFPWGEDSFVRVLSRTGELRNEQEHKMPRCRNYWCYSVGSAIAWTVVFILIRTIRGRESAQYLQLVIYGFCICWVSETIARYIYPPPKRWMSNRRQE